MDVLGRYRNLIVLVGVLFAQVLGLAVQVRRTTDSEPTRLIRVWAVGAVTPLEKALAWAQTSSGGMWHNYFYLRGVRAENRELKHEIERMRLEQARISQDADQAHRLQALLAFKEQFISQTMAAQVIGSSGSELSRSVYIDKGERDGIKPDMAVISKDGIVGKILRVYNSTSLVLLIDDQTSGVGSILDKSRLQGILRGTSSGEVVLEKVMSDETVPVGEQVLTSGGDGIFPKGLPVGTVTKVSPGSDLFLNIRVRPAADLNRLEEVLVVTKVDERQAEPEKTVTVRAADILAERLPSVPPKPETASESAGKSLGVTANGAVKPAPAAGSATAQSALKPQSTSESAGEAKSKSPSAGSQAAAVGNTGTLKAGTGSAPGTSPTKLNTGVATQNSGATKVRLLPTPGVPVAKKNVAGAAPSATAPVTGTLPATATGAAKKPPAKAVSLTTSPAVGSKPQRQPPQSQSPQLKPQDVPQ
ncbi:MAG: rod shape-determining protein MreC [Terriglobales bacterium]